MKLVPVGPSETLPKLIDQAVRALDSARDSAEILEARDMARTVYDAAKSAARIAKAKQAHDSILSEVHRAQANASYIRARAEMRLAEEYDEAQERGEVQKPGGDRVSIVAGNNNALTAADLGLRRDEIHEARRFRDAELADPGIIRRSLDGMLERGEEPTRAALRKEVFARPQQRTMDPKALWIWGRLKDFERDGILSADPDKLLAEMTIPMRNDVRRLLPLVREFIEEMETSA